MDTTLTLFPGLCNYKNETEKNNVNKFKYSLLSRAIAKFHSENFFQKLYVKFGRPLQYLPLPLIQGIVLTKVCKGRLGIVTAKHMAGAGPAGSLKHTAKKI